MFTAIFIGYLHKTNPPHQIHTATPYVLYNIWSHTQEFLFISFSQKRSARLSSIHFCTLKSSRNVHTVF